MIVEVLAAFIAALTFSVFFNVSPRESVYSGLVGGLGWLIYLITFQQIQDVIYSSFIAALVISIVSHFLARIRKNPVTIYQIGGMFPIVPGAGMYKTLYYIVYEDYTTANYYLFETLQIAGGIAVAMVMIAFVYNLLAKKWA